MSRPIIAAYHFPQWHPDPRNDRWHGPGWTEWALVRANPSRFPGHQPLQPAWGCHDESDPSQMAREIDLAADHGLDAFIFDTYWYEDGPFLDRAITEGFLRAPNRHRLRFACMWANHTWRNWHPCNATQHPWRDAAMLDGAVSSASWRRFAERIAGWMTDPGYLRLGGRPYFSIYQVRTFMQACGSLAAAADELAWFRALVRERTGVEPHLGAVWGRLGGLDLPDAEVYRRLGLESMTPYNCSDHHPIWEEAFPIADWAPVDAANRAAWRTTDPGSGLPYIPNLTTGWDSSARCCPSDAWQRRAYPWYPVLPDDAQRFGRELAALSDWFTAQPDALPMLTLNAWNEWTEGAVLLPTTAHGTALLEQVRKVFGVACPSVAQA
jgi:hypothetical protein